MVLSTGAATKPECSKGRGLARPFDAPGGADRPTVRPPRRIGQNRLDRPPLLAKPAPVVCHLVGSWPPFGGTGAPPLPVSGSALGGRTLLGDRPGAALSGCGGGGGRRQQVEHRYEPAAATGRGSRRGGRRNRGAGAIGASAMGAIRAVVGGQPLAGLPPAFGIHAATVGDGAGEQ